MQDNFYFKVDPHDEIKSIYRLVVDDLSQRIFELIWLGDKWVATEGLVGMIMKGEYFLEPVTPELVQKFTPYVDTGPYRPD